MRSLAEPGQIIAAIALRRPVAAVASVHGALAVTSDEGIVVMDGEGRTLSSLPLGPVRSLAVDGERLFALVGGELLHVDLSVPHAPVVRAGVPLADVAAISALGDGRVCALGAATACFAVNMDGALLPSGGAPFDWRSDDFHAGLDLARRWVKGRVGDPIHPNPYAALPALAVRGGGAGIAGTADAFTFVSQSGITGDFTVDVEVRSLAGADTKSRAGLMVRQDQTAGSVTAAIMLGNDGKVHFAYRKAAGDSLQDLYPASGFGPRWVRLVRFGNIVRGFHSSDGTTWTQVGSDQALQLSGSVRVGLAVSSGVLATPRTAVFSTFKFVGLGGETRSESLGEPIDLASKWTKADVGGDAMAAPTTTSRGVRVESSDGDISGYSDKLSYLWQNGVYGDFTATVRLDELGYAGSTTRAGLMVRQNLDAASPHFTVAGLPDGSSEIRWRASAQGSTSSVVSTGAAAPRWLRIVRSGANWSGFVSVDGVSWMQQGATQTVMLTDPVYVGLAGSSASGYRNVATFDDFSFSGAATVAKDFNGLAGQGRWLFAAQPAGLSILRAPPGQPPGVVGYFPALAGVPLTSGGEIYSLRADGTGFARLGLLLGTASPTVTIALPGAAPLGGRVALGATVTDPDTFDGYTAELLLNGAVVDKRDSRVPSWIDLPAKGSIANVVLRVRDMAGNVATAQSVVALTAPSEGPLLADLRVPATILEGAPFEATAVASEPGRVQSVEFSLVESGAIATAAAPVLTAELLGPAVASDTGYTLRAVAIDAQGRRGPALFRSMTVREDLTPGGPAVTVDMEGSGAKFEGTFVPVKTTVTSGFGVREVRLYTRPMDQGNFTLQQILSAPPYLGSVYVPMGIGSKTVEVKAVAYDLDGRSNFGVASFTSSDDTSAPVITFLKLDPGDILGTGTTIVPVAPGARITATAVTSVEDTSVEQIVVEVRSGTTSLAVGGSRVVFDVPADAAAGAIYTVIASAVDRSGNTAVPKVRTLVVTNPAVPFGAEAVASGPFAGATRMELRGDTLFALTPAGLQVARLNRGPTPSITRLGSYADTSIRDLAVLGDLAVVARGLAGLDVLDLATPSAPRLIGRFSDAFEWSRVRAGGGGVYASRADGSSYRLNIAEPSRPTPGSAALGTVVAAQGVGSFLSNASALYVYGALDSGQPMVWGTLTGALTAVMDGDLFVAGTETSLQLATLTSTLANISPAGSVDLPAGGGARSMGISGGMAFVACKDAKLRVVDVRDPVSPRILATTALDAQEVVVSAGLLLAATPQGVEVHRIPVGTSSAPARLGVVTMSDRPASLTAFRRGVLAATNLFGATRIDLGDPTAPTAVAKVIGGATPSVLQVEHVDRDVYYLQAGKVRAAAEQAKGTGAAAFVDKSGESTSLAALGDVTRFHLTSHRLWGVAGPAGMVKTAVIPAVTATSSLSLGRTIYDVAGYGDRALVALGSSGLAVVETDGGGAIVQVGAAGLDANAVGLAGSMAVAGNATELVTLQLSAAGGLAAVASVATAGPVQRIRLTGRLAVVSELNAVEVWDLSEPAAPVRLALFGTAAAKDAVVVQGGIVAVADGTDVLAFPLPASAGAAKPAVRLIAPAAGLEVAAGKTFDITTESSGVQQDLELLIDGRSVGRLLDSRPYRTPGADDVAPRVRWTLPSWATPGSFVRVQVRGVAGSGAEILSEERQVRVAAAVPSPIILNSFTLTSGGASGYTSFYGGEKVNVSVCRMGGVGPFTATVRFGTMVLGSLAQGSGTCFAGDVRMPVVSTREDGIIAVEVIDALGTVGFDAKTGIALKAKVASLPAPSLNPSSGTALKALTPTNVSSSLTADALMRIQLYMDGEIVATSTETRGGTANLWWSWTPPTAMVGKTVVLKAIGMDSAGNVSPATERSYVVAPDGVKPAVSTLAPLSLGSSADGSYPVSEGAVLTVSATASDADGDLRYVVIRDGDTELARVDSGTNQGSQSVTATYQVPSLVEQPDGVRILEAIGVDAAGRSSTAKQLTLRIATNQPPTLSFSGPDYPTQGYVETFCTKAIDDATIAALSLTIDGIEFTGTPTSCRQGDSVVDCRTFCVPYLVPQTATMFVSGAATDAFGATVEDFTYFSPVLNDAPHVSVERRDYLIAGAPVRFSGIASDEGAFRFDFIADGTAVFTADGQTSWPMTAIYTPGSAGTTHLEFRVTDTPGLIGSVIRDTPVLAAGTGASCSAPVALPATGDLRPLYTSLPQPVTSCVYYTINAGTWLSLPFDGPVEAMQLLGGDSNYRSTVAACGGTLQCGSDDLLGPLPKDARILVGQNCYSTPCNSEPIVSIAWARLGIGAKCDPAWTNVSCSVSSACRKVPDTSEYRCTAAACSNGLDDDHDGKSDWPNDPGCWSAEDDSESDPAKLPACANGRDDDGDLLTDRPEDGGCLSAASDDEARCGLKLTGVLSSLALPIKLWGDTSKATNSSGSICGMSAPGGDDVYEWTAPSTGTFRIGVEGKGGFQPFWSLGKGYCSWSVLACRTSSGSADVSLARGEHLTLRVDEYGAGGIYAITLEQIAGLLPPDAGCDPASTSRICESGFCEADGSGVERCRSAACANGQDDDHDGKFDWPNDPGCSFAGDDSEADPASPPACANGADDDGDLATDWPADVQCAAASGHSERFCSGGADGVISEVPVRIVGTTVGGSNTRTSCAWGSCSPERVFEFTAPAAGTYQFDTSGSLFTTIVSIRETTCDGAELACRYLNGFWNGDFRGAIVQVPMAARQTMAVVVDGDSNLCSNPSQGTFVLSITQTGGHVAPTEPCDPASTDFTCEAGFCEPDADGAYKCRLARCANGVDDDGDGKTDWLEDPGCTHLGDDDETDPATPPRCADGIDNDGDLATDFPADAQCSAPSGTSETFCSYPVAAVIDSEALSVTLGGSTFGASNVLPPAASCHSPQAAPEEILEWRVPYSGSYEIDTAGSTFNVLLSVRGGTCTAEPLSCGDAGGIWDDNHHAFASMSGWFEAGQTVAIVIDGADATDIGDYRVTVRLTGGVLPRGAPCDPAQSGISCEDGTTCVPEVTGQLRCAPPQCSNGHDDDGDGLFDWPNDPGCSSALDVSEDSPVVTACSNGLDDDGDGLVDFPEDPQCGAASSESESFCESPPSGILGTLPLPIVVEGATVVGGASDFTTNCGYTDDGAPDALYQWTAPADGVYQIDTFGSDLWAMLTVRDAACGGAELACNAEGTGADGNWTSIVNVALQAHQTVAIVVDGIQGSAGPYVIRIQESTRWLPSGAACSPTSTILCLGGTCLPEPSGVNRCRIGACGNGLDDDGDGATDWPNDPGCASVDDDDESNPTTAPVCANDVDEDGDLLTDFPADTGCGGASGGSETFCAEVSSPLLVGAPLRVAGHVGGNSRLPSGACVGDGPELVYEWVAPATGTYWIDTMGSSVDSTLTIKDGGCNGTFLVCDDDSGGNLTSALAVDLTAGRRVAIIVDTYYPEAAGDVVLNFRTTAPITCNYDGSGLYWACLEPACAWRPGCFLPLTSNTPPPAERRRRRRRRIASLRQHRLSLRSNRQASGNHS